VVVTGPLPGSGGGGAEPPAAVNAAPRP
jgi:hypothetical protein